MAKILFSQILLIIFLLISCTSPGKKEIIAEKGILDLNNYDFSANDPIALNGEWIFFNQELLEPEDLGNINFKDPVLDYLVVPQKWNNQDIKGVEIPSKGFGTYFIRVILPNDENSYSFYLPNIFHSSKFWLNGDQIYSSGIVGQSPDESKPEERTDIYPFSSTGGTLDIVIQVSNYWHRDGGITKEILLGTNKQIYSGQISKLVVNFVIIGSIIFMGLYHLFLSFILQDKKSSILFTVLCFLSVVRMVFARGSIGPYFLYNIPWVLYYRIEYLSLFAAIPVFLYYVYLLFPFKPLFNLVKIYILSGVVVIMVLLTSRVNFFSRLIVVFQVYALIGIVFAMVFFAISFVQKKRGSAIFLTGLLIFFVISINDSLYYNSIIRTGELLYFGYWAFLLAQSLVLANRVSFALNTVTELSHNLEEKVMERTKELSESNIQLQFEIIERRKIEKELLHLSRTDSLTGVANRLKFCDSLDEAIKCFKRYKNEFSVIMFDVDHFKQVNDTYGHDIGDLVLKRISQVVKSLIRDVDLLARWGGEEFIILMINNSKEGTLILAERIRAKLEASDFKPVPRITSSFGVTMFHEKDDEDNFLKRVDNALYEAKNNGRNCVVYL